MNKKPFWLYKNVLLFCFFLVFVDYSVCAQGKKLTILTEEWPPYNYIENGQLKGFSVGIVKEIIKELKAEYDIQILPSMRTSHILNNGSRAMMFSMLRIPERERKYKWIGPLADSSIYFYKKKGNPIVISTLEDAKKVDLIACRNGGLVLNKLKQAGFLNLDTSANNGVQIYKKLLKNRCDLGISESPLGVKYILKKMNYPLDSLVQTSVKVVDSVLYMACTKDIPDREIALWQEALDKIKASGIYDAIQKKYSE